MADTKIDKSLDDIIKERKISGRRGGAARGALRGRRSAGNGAPPRRGGIMKRRSGGSPVKGAGSINGNWGHDLYANGGSGGARRAAQAFQAVAAQAASQTGPSKLSISNLDFGVNDNDIKGLFQEFGIIRKAAVHYDRTGRSLGTADVVFERKADAIRALRKYNGVSLDGRPMNIQLTAPIGAIIAPPAMVPRAGRISGSPRGGGGGAGFRRKPQFAGRGGAGGRGAGRGGARGGRAPKPEPKSAADLDADLDAYTKMQTD